jgi:hypothetical protein
MTSTVNRTMGAVSGRAIVVAGAVDRPLKNVRVDMYRFRLGPDGASSFERMNRVSARTDVFGRFSFTDPRDLQVPVEVRLLGSGAPPYTPVEHVLARSLPSLVFHVTVDTEVLPPGGGASVGSDFREVFDERSGVTPDWLAANPDRVRVPLSGAAGLTVSIDPSAPEAALLAGVDAGSAPPGTQVHLLRVGRATRDEIQAIGSGKAGYMTSGPASVEDAPFARTLHIGGHFGADFPLLSGNLYYALSFARYTGTSGSSYTDAIGASFDPSRLTGRTPIRSPLVNRRYILPTGPTDPGRWQNLNLGPFDGTITEGDPSMIGTIVQVYQRPPLPNPVVEYYPFWDLLAVWDSSAAPNDLVVLQIEAYQRVGGTADRPQLKPLSIAPSVNDHLPLRIDNRPPVLKLNSLHQGTARVAAPLQVSDNGPLNDCGNLRVTDVPADRNACLIPTYSIEDGSGNAHPHVAGYELSVTYSPRGALGSAAIPLIFGGFPDGIAGGHPVTYHAIAGSYAATSPPELRIFNQSSVIVPSALHGWPPQSDGATPCPQYAASINLSASVRAVDGWGRAFGPQSLARYIILSR